MSSKEIQAEISGLLARNESAVAELYSQYSIIFPEYADFWGQISKEEIGHADAIKDLASKSAAGGVFFNDVRFKKEAIKLSISSIEKELWAAKIGPITHKQAVAAALNIEDALLESKMFNIFAGDSAEVKALLTRLTAETLDHRTRLRSLSQKIAGA